MDDDNKPRARRVVRDVPFFRREADEFVFVNWLGFSKTWPSRNEFEEYFQRLDPRMFPFHMPPQVWWFSALLYLCVMLSVVWVRFARESASQQLAQFTSVTCFVVLTVHLVHEIISGSGFWLGGSIVYVVLAVTCVFEPSATKPTRQI